MTFARNSIAIFGWYSGAGPLIRAIKEPRELIVAYHTIQERNTSFSHINISFDMFQKHVAYLRGRGYTFHKFQDALSGFGNKRAYLYFDDGFATIHKHVYPYLRAGGIPATLFVTTEYIDQRKNGVYLTWDAVRQMTDVFEIGSHGTHHIKLNKISLEEAEQEMKTSKERIEQMIGKPVRSFSYPKGRSTKDLEELAHRVGYTITTSDPRFHKIRPDPDDSKSIIRWKIVL